MWSRGLLLAPVAQAQKRVKVVTYACGCHGCKNLALLELLKATALNVLLAILWDVQRI